ncbi:MAG: hypothetical protein IPQ09_08190 [Myxococcales bacterium]|nr:hypothetical protein [Myxococcales bacterium]
MTAPPASPTAALASRRAALAAFSALGVVVALARPSPVEASSAGVALLLGRATGRVVGSGDYRWEASRGAALDALFGRRVLFLAGAAKDAPRDLFRARVRVTPEGRVLEVVDARNLTATDLGDDHALVLLGDKAAYATYAFGQEQSVSYLDLAGEGPQNLATHAADRVMSAVTNYQQTGSFAGIGRVDLTLELPTPRLGLALDEGGLRVSLADGASARSARLDGATREVVPEAEGVHAQAVQHLPKRPIFWAVDTVRAMPEIGPAPIAWLEERAFYARDQARRLSFKVGGGAEGSELAKAAPPPPKLLDAAEAGEGGAGFPPADIPSIWKNPQEGEGAWVVPTQAWLKRFPSFPGVPGQATAPSMFYRTFVRSDEERPYAKVLLVAMDMRQLDLGMEGGMEDPKPAVGPPGAGRIPREKAVFGRVAAAFNGGFKTEHGSYGMMVRRRVLLPPQPGAAAVVLLKDGRVGMGSWGNTTKVSGLAGIDDGDILSFRQNLDPLLDGDKVNPTGRSLWGFTLPGTSMQTERSGICVTPAGHMLYAWGDDVSANTLGKAMKMAGCVYGMHLDMNPHHTGLVFTNITEIKGKAYKTELLTNQMEISPDRFIEFSPKDFFYMMVSDPTPPPLEGARPWAPEAGTQPAPAWHPGVWSTRTALGVEVSLVSSGRATYRIRGGKREPSGASGEALHELGEADAKRALFALTLGTSPEKRPWGLATDGRVVHSPHAAAPTAAASGEGRALLVAREDGALAIQLARELPADLAHHDYAELPLLADEGRAVGDRPARAALGIASGNVYIARASAAGRGPVEALVALGCERVVQLERGVAEPVSWHRSGTSAPPHASYDATTLYAVAKPLAPRGFRFLPTSPVPPPTKR